MIEEFKPVEKPSNGWLCPLCPDRPTYECPKCNQMAMQFHAKLVDQPGREDFFRCCACGSFWEV